MLWYVALVIALLILVPLAFAGLSFAPWVPIWERDLNRVMRLANLKPGEMFYDLGCGNGKAVFYAAKHCQAKAIGVELVWILWLWCKIRQFFQPNPLVQFKLGNLFHQSLRDANVVYVFGMPKPLQAKLVKKLLAELSVGSRVVSYTFPIAGLPNEFKDKPSPDQIAIYCYTITGNSTTPPLNV